jgi:hypothetical protein
MTFAEWIKLEQILDSKGRPKRVFHGSPRVFQAFKMEMPRSTTHEAAGIGIWFTDDPLVATEFAHKIDTEYVTHKDDTWPDGELKKYAQDKHLYGKVHAVYLNITNPKVYAGQDGFESMMDDRDNFAEYISGVKNKPGYWRTKYIALNKEETNKQFVAHLKSQGYDGIVLQNTKWDAHKGRGRNNQYIVFDPSQIRKTT